MKSSDGEELWHVEEVTDPAVINAYIRHRQMIEEQATSAEFLEPTDDEEKNKRLRKRIQDQLAKLKRNLERRMQRAAARQTVSGETSAVPQKEKKTEQVVRTFFSYTTVFEVLVTA
ncbi:8659_t:CDS:2 [Paraglomus occultum]|uniref:8659_t:CDS:1 n=1 Tax=Paraglomus occultum TaxID=144539 RepID=A0A9N9GMZ5_9GLOM|nr:8659_t:CDS:2 [Paraglomus occultum]